VSASLPLWIQSLVALLLLAGGVLALTGAVGLLRYGDFFRRMHPPALAASLSALCVTLASSIYFSAVEQQLALYPLLINALLAMTTPVTTVLLARAALSRGREASASALPPLGAPEHVGPHPDRHADDVSGPGSRE
jgi:multicomponent K+:H+ antiporter subunit G